MKVSNDIATPAMGTTDTKSADGIDAGEFAALLAGIAGLQGLVPQLDLTAIPEAATSASPAATQLPALVLAMATMPNLDLQALAQMAAAAGEGAAATFAPDVVEVQVLSAEVGEIVTPAPNPLTAGSETAADPLATTADADGAPTPTVTTTVGDTPIVLVAGDASTATDAGAGQDAGATAIAKAAAPVATKETTKGDDTTMIATAAAMAPGAPDVRPNEPTKMVVPPTRIDTVAVAAARASIDANRPIRLTVRLDPPNLGELRVELTARGSQVTVRLEPTNANVAPTLSQQRSAVAEALERTGFNLSGFDISNPEQQQQQQQAFSQKRSAARVAAVEELEAEDVAPAQGLRI